MSILIKGMEMPKNCYECLVRNQGFSGDGMKCGKTGSVLSWYDGNRKRMDDCPLVSVPSHGDLIDRKPFVEFIKTHWDGYDQWFVGQLEARPTIIPADPAEEGET